MKTSFSMTHGKARSSVYSKNFLLNSFVNKKKYGLKKENSEIFIVATDLT